MNDDNLPPLALLHGLNERALKGELGPNPLGYALAAAQVETPQQSLGKRIRSFFAYRDHAAFEYDYQVFCFFVLTYFSALRENEEAANGLINAIAPGYPGLPDSSLERHVVRLIEAQSSYQELDPERSQSGSLKTRMWNTMLQLVQMHHEFLSGLTGYVLLCWRAALGRSINTNVLENSYGSKVNELHGLLDENSKPHSAYLRALNPELRNAIAHADIQIGSNYKRVRYKAGRQAKKSYHVIGTDDFILHHVQIASHFHNVYFAAIATCWMTRHPDDKVWDEIPSEVVGLMEGALRGSNTRQDH